MTPKPNGLRAPGEKTPQDLRTRANKATKLRILLYEPLLGVNTYVLLGTNAQLNQRIFIYIFSQTYLIIFRINTKACLGQST